MVGRMRQCYETEMRFWADDNGTIPVRYYFVPEGTPRLPYRTPFRSHSDTQKEGESWGGLGEVYAARHRRTDGTSIRNPFFWGFGEPHGTAEQWYSGSSINASLGEYPCPEWVPAFVLDERSNLEVVTNWCFGFVAKAGTALPGESLTGHYDLAFYQQHAVPSGAALDVDGWYAPVVARVNGVVRRDWWFIANGLTNGQFLSVVQLWQADPLLMLASWQTPLPIPPLGNNAGTLVLFEVNSDLFVWPEKITATSRCSPVLIGTVLFDAGIDPVPPLYLLCDGKAVSRSDYALLFARLGTRYGNGNGSTTFNLPDLRNRCPVGSNGIYNAGDKFGEDRVTLDINEITAHQHQLAAYSAAISATPGSLSVQGVGDPPDNYPVTGYNGGYLSHENRQPSLALRPLIYAGQMP